MAKEKEMTPAEELESIRERLKLLDPEASKRLAEAEAEAADEKKQVEQEKDYLTRVNQSPHVWVIFTVGGVDDMDTVVPIRAAGWVADIPKGVAVPLPKCVLGSVDYAVMEGTRKAINYELGIAYAQKFRFPRFPYTVIRDATMDEVEQWRRESREKAEKENGYVLGQEAARAIASRSVIQPVDTGPNPFTATPVGQ